MLHVTCPIIHIYVLMIWLSKKSHTHTLYVTRKDTAPLLQVLSLSLAKTVSQSPGVSHRVLTASPVPQESLEVRESLTSWGGTFSRLYET